MLGKATCSTWGRSLAVGAPGEWVVDHSGASVLIALINHFHQRSRLDRLVDTQAADE
jgi:hypothetical protein